MLNLLSDMRKSTLLPVPEFWGKLELTPYQTESRKTTQCCSSPQPCPLTAFPLLSLPLPPLSPQHLLIFPALSPLLALTPSFQMHFPLCQDVTVHSSCPERVLPCSHGLFLHLQGEEPRNTTKAFSPKPQTTCKQGVNDNKLSTRPNINNRNEISDRGWGCSDRTKAAQESRNQ